MKLRRLLITAGVAVAALLAALPSPARANSVQFETVSRTEGYVWAADPQPLSAPPRVTTPPDPPPDPPPTIQPPIARARPLSPTLIPVPAPPPVAVAPLPPPPSPTSPPPPPPAAQSAAKSPDTSDLDIFSGGSNSLVARTVGHAEGTRTPDGSKTRAYQGHSDPGNGVWNLGSFSFQHCREAQYNCSTAEEADVHQLRRLQGQADRLLEKADSLGISMSLEEELNAIDLANQAPAAALGEPGYTDWLKKARDKGLTDEEAILWARVSSFWEPGRGWNAPGLGNSEANITHDQNRRMTAIARALNIYNQQVAAGKIEPPRQAKAQGKPRREEIADRIIWQDLPVAN